MLKFIAIVAVVAGAFIAGTMNSGKVAKAENTAYASIHDNCAKVPYRATR